MDNKNRRILIIDDDTEIWNVNKSILMPQNTEQGSSLKKITTLLDVDNNREVESIPEFRLSYKPQGQEGYTLLKDYVKKGDPFAVAFIDVRMPPGWDGMETATRIRQIDPKVEIVIVTAFSDRTREEIVTSVGAPDKLLFLRKPFDPEELTQIALSLTEKWNLARREESANIALKESEARFRSLVETTTDWVWETDVNGCFTYCSPVCISIYGYMPDELMGKTIFDTLLPEEGAKEFKQLFLKQEDNTCGLHGVERRCIGKDGRNLYIETSCIPVIDLQGKTIGFRGIDRDITLRKRMEKEKTSLEKQYRQAQKLEAIGTLAGGIAHDFNNILSGIMGYTQLISLELKEAPQAGDFLNKIMSACGRASDLINQILAFSRPTETQKMPVSLKMITKEVLKLLRASLPSNIEIQHKISTSSDYILADTTQIHQILMNLGTNAAHALGKKGGILEINLSDTTIIPDNKAYFPELNEGPHVALIVRDNGHGMDTETIEKIFEPFFTTKERGKGTGLGLSVIHGIIHSHNGAIRVHSIPGKGTEFQIFLPTVKDQLAFELKPQSKRDLNGNERILFVDDEEPLVETFKNLLGKLGYAITGSLSSTQALEIFAGQPDNFDMVITDMTMPTMTGDDLAKNILAIRPDIPVILCSGYGDSISKENASAIGIREFLMKPVESSRMAEIIRNVFDEKA